MNDDDLGAFTLRVHGSTFEQIVMECDGSCGVYWSHWTNSPTLADLLKAAHVHFLERHV